jgi:serine protease Do
MASKTAILIGGILLLLAATGRGAETDPVRRSLVVEAVERASPAVVNVSTEEVVEQRGSPFPFPQDPFFDEFFRDFRDPRPRRFTRESLGSGVIVAADGTILTNLHVILRASRIHVTLATSASSTPRSSAPTPTRISRSCASRPAAPCPTSPSARPGT